MHLQARFERSIFLHLVKPQPKLHNPILCNDRDGSFVYGQKRSINVNHGDTLNHIFLSQTLINFTSFPTVLSEGLALLITFNGVTTCETYAGDHRRRSIS